MVNRRPSQVGYLLKQAQAVLRARMDDVLRPFGLSVPQYVCLELLSHDPGISASDLARAAFVSRQSMNAVLQALLDRGLVERPARAASGRALPAALTASGAALLGRAQAATDEVERRMLSGLDEGEAAALGQALAACVAALDEPA